MDVEQINRNTSDLHFYCPAQKCFPSNCLYITVTLSSHINRTRYFSIDSAAETLKRPLRQRSSGFRSSRCARQCLLLLMAGHGRCLGGCAVVIKTEGNAAGVWIDVGVVSFCISRKVSFQSLFAVGTENSL